MGGPAGTDDLERPLLADEAEQAPGPLSEGALSPSPSDLSLQPLAHPATRPLKPLTQVCPYILANEFCERLAYYGLATNLVSFFGGAFRRTALLCATAPRAAAAHCLQPLTCTLDARVAASAGVMQYSTADSAAAVQSWSASCYMTAVLGAVVADSALGRYAHVSARALRRP